MNKFEIGDFVNEKMEMFFDQIVAIELVYKRGAYNFLS